MKDQFYKIKADKQEYWGNRYFRYNHEAEKVVQVCVNPGEIKKGRTNTFGVYLIGRLTFITNYLAIGNSTYVEPCTKKEFKKAMEKVIKQLDY